MQDMICTSASQHITTGHTLSGCTYAILRDSCKLLLLAYWVIAVPEADASATSSVLSLQNKRLHGKLIPGCVLLSLTWLHIATQIAQ